MKGWHRESKRHSLARKGIKTKKTYSRRKRQLFCKDCKKLIDEGYFCKDCRRKKEIRRLLKNKFSLSKSEEKLLLEMKKKYPQTKTADSNIILLPEEKYKDIARKLNPDRVYEAMTSNAFYDPVQDRIYIRDGKIKKSEPLKIKRLKIHELAHDSGHIDEERLNEGMTEKIAKDTLVSMGHKKDKVKKVLDYPKLVTMIEILTKKIGKESFIKAYFETHQSKTIYDALEKEGVQFPKTYIYEIMKRIG